MQVVQKKLPHESSENTYLRSSSCHFKFKPFKYLQKFSVLPPSFHGIVLIPIDSMPFCEWKFNGEIPKRCCSLKHAFCKIVGSHLFELCRPLKVNYVCQLDLLDFIYFFLCRCFPALCKSTLSELK